MDRIEVSWVAWLDKFIKGIDRESNGEFWRDRVLDGLSSVDFVSPTRVVLPPRTSPAELPANSLVYALPDEITTSLLAIIPGHKKKEMRCAVLGRSREKADTEIRLWRDQVTQATVKTVGVTERFKWVAVIGPVPSSSVAATGYMNGPYDLDGLRLTNTDGAYPERWPSSTNVFATHSSTTWPLIVRGESSGLGWQRSVQPAVLNRLKLLCGLLTLVTVAPWSLRVEPAIDDGREVTMPGQLPPATEPPSTAGQAPGSDRLPSWFAEGHRRVSNDPDLAAGLTTFLEGSLLADSYPSFANLAFVAVIESHANRGVEPPRCEIDACPAGHPVIKSQARFREMLGSVVHPDVAKFLTKRLYDNRSKTLHAAQLHGGESIFGIQRGSLNLLSENPTTVFESLASHLRMDARNLLIRALSDEGTI